MRHQTGDEGNVTGQAIELGDDDGALEAAGIRQGGGKNRAAFERVGALPRLDLDTLGDDLEVLGLSETGEGSTLRLDPEAALALPCGGNPEISGKWSLCVPREGR